MQGLDQGAQHQCLTRAAKFLTRVTCTHHLRLQLATSSHSPEPKLPLCALAASFPIGSSCSERCHRSQAHTTPAATLVMLLSTPAAFLESVSQGLKLQVWGKFSCTPGKQSCDVAGWSTSKREGPFSLLLPFVRTFPKEPQGEVQAAVGSWRILQDQSVTSCFMLLMGTGSSVAPKSTTEGSMVSSFTCTAMTSKRQRGKNKYIKSTHAASLYLQHPRTSSVHANTQNAPGFQPTS